MIRKLALAATAALLATGILAATPVPAPGAKPAPKTGAQKTATAKVHPVHPAHHAKKPSAKKGEKRSAVKPTSGKVGAHSKSSMAPKSSRSVRHRGATKRGTTAGTTSSTPPTTPTR